MQTKLRGGKERVQGEGCRGKVAEEKRQSKGEENQPVRLFKQLTPVPDGHAQVAAKDEVNRVGRLDPSPLDIVNDELYVWRYQGILHGTEVDASDASERVPPAHCSWQLAL